MGKVDERALARAYNEGLRLEKAGDAEGAAAAYARALALDPADRGGVAVRLAAMGRGPVPDRAPPAYVATLFGQHAEAFDDILVGRLGYRTPQDLAAALGPLGPFERMLDLGCGTGLAAAALAGITAHRTGVDLAEPMLALADARGVYDDLYAADAEGFLEAAAEEGETWDLIVAADVAPYLGDLRPLLRLAADRLAPGGVLAFSTERAPDDGAGWVVLPGRRFAHADPWLRGALAEAGLSVLALEAVTIRWEEGAPAPGQLAVARRCDGAPQGARPPS
jgi:predicted TPR repeat methyltransferase